MDKNSAAVQSPCRSIVSGGSRLLACAVMRTNRPRGIPLITLWELVLSFAIVGLSGALAGFCIAPLIAINLDVDGSARWTATVADHLGASLHLLALGAMVSLRGARARFASWRPLRGILLLGVVVIGVMAAIGAARLYPAVGAAGWSVIGLNAAAGLGYVAAMLSPRVPAPEIADAVR